MTRSPDGCPARREGSTRGWPTAQPPGSVAALARPGTRAGGGSLQCCSFLTHLGWSSFSRLVSKEVCWYNAPHPLRCLVILVPPVIIPPVPMHAHQLSNGLLRPS